MSKKRFPQQANAKHSEETARRKTITNNERYPEIEKLYKALWKEGFGDYLVSHMYANPEWRKSISYVMKQHKTPLSIKLQPIGRPDGWTKSGMKTMMIRLLMQGDSSVFSYIEQIAELHPYHLETTISNCMDEGTTDNSMDEAEVDANVELDADIYREDVLAQLMHQIAAMEDINALVETLKAMHVVLIEEKQRQAELENLQVKENSGETVAAEPVPDVKKLEKKIGLLEKELKTERRRVSSRDRANTKLRSQIKDLQEQAQANAAENKKLKEFFDEAKREVKRQKALVKQEQKGRINVAQKRDETTRSASDLERELADLNEFATQCETEMLAAKEEFRREALKREDIEATLNSFGFDNLASSVDQISSALEMFGQLRDALTSFAYQKEEDRKAAQKEASDRDLLEYEARLEQEKIDQRELAIGQFYIQKLEVFEARLFDEHEPARIIIDGHNLLHSTKRPESEPNTRKWIIKLMREFSERVQNNGFNPRIDLVFDSPHDENTVPENSLLYVTYAKKCSEISDGTCGADGFIVNLLEQVHPSSHIALITSDKRHIWAQAKELQAVSDLSVDYIEASEMGAHLENMQKLIDL